MKFKTLLTSLLVLTSISGFAQVVNSDGEHGPGNNAVRSACEVITDINDENTYQQYKVIQKIESFAINKNISILAHDVNEDQLQDYSYDYAILTKKTRTESSRAFKDDLDYIVVDSKGDVVYETDVTSFKYPKDQVKQYFAYENTLIRGYKRALRFISNKNTCK